MGITVYLLLQVIGTKRSWAFGVGLVVVAALRLLAVLEGWQLPTFRLP